MTTYKIAILGAELSGKSSYMRLLLTGKIVERYTPTIGVEVHPYVCFFDGEGKIHTGTFASVNDTSTGVEVYSDVFTGEKNRVCYNVWDFAGNEKFKGISQSMICDRADCVIVMFDVSSRRSFATATKEIVNLREKTPGIPVVLVGNKIDKKVREVNRKDIEASNSFDCSVRYCEMSVRSKEGIYSPIEEMYSMLR